MFIPRCFRCTAKANRASAARSRQKRIANLENLRSDNAELEWKNKEAAAELAKIKKKNQELCNKNPAMIVTVEEERRAQKSGCRTSFRNLLYFSITKWVL